MEKLLPLHVKKQMRLASTFAAVSQTAHLSLEEQTRRMEEERKFLHPLPDNEAVYQGSYTKAFQDQLFRNSRPIRGFFTRGLLFSFLSILAST
jgi:hypothetical protein